ESEANKYRVFRSIASAAATLGNSSYATKILTTLNEFILKSMNPESGTIKVLTLAELAHSAITIGNNNMAHTFLNSSLEQIDNINKESSIFRSLELIVNSVANIEGIEYDDLKIELFLEATSDCKDLTNNGKKSAFFILLAKKTESILDVNKRRDFLYKILSSEQLIQAGENKDNMLLQFAKTALTQNEWQAAYEVADNYAFYESKVSIYTYILTHLGQKRFPELSTTITVIDSIGSSYFRSEKEIVSPYYDYVPSWDSGPILWPSKPQSKVE
ncbi:MAG: hypothetical protein ACRBF0_04125, partial [Calditrichia bacterium]